MSADGTWTGIERLAAMSRRELLGFLESLAAPVSDETWRVLRELIELESAPEIHAAVHRARERILGESREPVSGTDRPRQDLEPARALLRSLLGVFLGISVLGSVPGSAHAQEVSLDLRTDPPGAAAYLDEKPVGRTPLQRLVPVTGIPRLLRFERPGHHPLVQALGRSEGIGLPIVRKVTLLPHVSRVRVDAVPRAMVLRDQAPLGMTPVEVDVTGETLLELVSPGHYPEPVTLIAGGPEQEVFHLLSENDSRAAASDHAMALARQRLAAGDLPLALEGLQALHARSPRSLHHVDLLVHCLLRATFVEEAARLVEAAAGIDPHPGWIAALTARCLDAGAPVAPLLAAIARVPPSSEEAFLRTVARLELARGEPGRSIELLELAPGGKAVTERLRVRARHDLRDIEQLARAVLGAVLAGVDPVECWPSLEYLAQRSGERGIFVPLPSDSGGLPPGATDEVRRYLDQLLTCLRALERSEYSRALEESQRLPPWKPRALIQSRVQLGRQDARAALFTMAPLWEDASAGGAAAVTLGRAYFELGDPEAEASLLRRVRSDDLTHRSVLLDLASRRLAAGEHREAVTLIARLRELHPSALHHKPLRADGASALRHAADAILATHDVISITLWAEEWSAFTAPSSASSPGVSRPAIERLVGAIDRAGRFRDAVLAHDWDAAVEHDAALETSGVLPLEPFLAGSKLPEPLNRWARMNLAGLAIEGLRAVLIEAQFARALAENDHREAARRAWQMMQRQPQSVRPHLLWIASWIAVGAPYALILVMLLLIGSTARSGRRGQRRRLLLEEIEDCLMRAEHRRLRDLWNEASRADLPADPGTRLRVAGFLAEGGHLDLAERLLEALPVGHRDSWAGIRTRLRLLTARREHAAAVTFLKRAMSSPGWELPSPEEMLEVHVEVLMAAGEAAAAAERVREALAHPTRPRLRPALVERIMDLMMERGDLDSFMQLLRIAPSRRVGSPERVRGWIALLDMRGSDTRDSRLCRVVLGLMAGRARDAVEALRRMSDGFLPGPADVEWMLETIRGTTEETWFTDALAEVADAALDHPDLDDGIFLTFARHLETHGRVWDAYRCLLRISPDSFKFPSVLPRIRTLARRCLDEGRPELALLMQRRLVEHGVSVEAEETFITKLAAGFLPAVDELPAGRVARASYASLRERVLEELRVARLDQLLAGEGGSAARVVLPHRLEPNALRPEPLADDEAPYTPWAIEVWARELAACATRLDHPVFPRLREARGPAVTGRVALALELAGAGGFPAARDLIRDWRVWQHDLPPPERGPMADILRTLEARCGEGAAITGGSARHGSFDRQDERSLIEDLQGQFAIQHLVSSSARGVVYLAEHAEKGSVALKLFAAPGGGPGAAHDGHRLLKSARLQHPNLVTIHQLGEGQGTRWVAMEYVAGIDLAERLRARGRLDCFPVRTLMKDILGALDALHRAGLVHGDLSAANLRLAAGDRPVLLDAGSVRRSGERAPAGSWTPRYAAPELVAGLPAGERADLFSLAALAYHLVTGHPPFPGNSVTEVTSVMRRGPVPPGCRSPGVDRRFEEWILRSLDPDPARRHASASEMLRELEVA